MSDSMCNKWVARCKSIGGIRATCCRASPDTRADFVGHDSGAYAVVPPQQPVSLFPAYLPMTEPAGRTETETGRGMLTSGAYQILVCARIGRVAMK